MKIISEIITDHSEWQRFLTYKLEGGHLRKSEAEDITAYVENKEYLPFLKLYLDGGELSVPRAVVLNKQYSNKKRTVFIYPREENYFLKFIAYALSRYDSIFCNNLCSFRKGITVKTAIRSLTRTRGIGDMYSYKVDISDYFNSVDIDILLPILEKTLSDDRILFEFLKKLLCNPYAIKGEEKVAMKKGIMAGVPVSSFLANLYLCELDKWFCDREITYIRYSDDIIIFGRSEEEVTSYSERIKQLLSQYRLTVNPSKELYVKAGDRWEFLGFSYHKGVVDISEIALSKLKSKMKRKARALVRWREKKNLEPYKAVKAFIKKFNMKLYSNADDNGITWSRWYFPVINTDKSLKILDSYMQDCIRYIAKGNYSKSRYNFRYEDMKKLGYKSLVNSFYKEYEE
ncbi:MAG: hypothetical protein IJZ51_00065 [Ruminiclostridium sp.]|nr:hypothetical protein [Ruminiclostridium sp.]